MGNIESPFSCMDCTRNSPRNSLHPTENTQKLNFTKINEPNKQNYFKKQTSRSSITEQSFQLLPLPSVESFISEVTEENEFDKQRNQKISPSTRSTQKFELKSISSIESDCDLDEKYKTNSINSTPVKSSISYFSDNFTPRSKSIIKYKQGKNLVEEIRKKSKSISFPYEDLH